MPKLKRRKRPPKRVLALPDLEQTKSAVLNSLTSKSGQRTYDHATLSSSIGIAQSRDQLSTAPLSFDTESISSSGTWLRHDQSPSSCC